MSRRYLLLTILALLLWTLAWQTKPVGAIPAPALPHDADSPCAERLTWRHRAACFPYGPYVPAARRAGVQLPHRRPPLEVEPLASPAGSAVPFIYAQVVQDDLPVYKHPSDAANGLPPKRRLGVGFLWVSVQGQTTFEGTDYYQINPQEYVAREALSLYEPSAFQGVALAEPPSRPLAWILTAVRPALTPGGEPNGEAPLYRRYQLVEIHGTQQWGEQVWYLIGPDQWINQIYVGKVTPSAPPAGVGAGAAWIDVNLFEQTLAAYVGDRMVYATLISSGLPGWDTPPGLFQVWRAVETGKMSGAYNRPDYYFLEDVPWALYFNHSIALHGAYWHDSFGYKHSHGCVNLAPFDANWLFNWAPEAVWVRVQSGAQPVTN